MKIVTIASFLSCVLVGCGLISQEPPVMDNRSFDPLMSSAEKMVEKGEVEIAKVLLDSAISISITPKEKSRASLNLLNVYRDIGDLKGRINLVQDAYPSGGRNHIDSIFYHMYTFEVLTAENKLNEALYYIDWLAINNSEGDEALLDFNWIHGNYAQTYFMMGDTLRGCHHLDIYLPEIFEGSDCEKRK